MKYLGSALALAIGLAVPAHAVTLVNGGFEGEPNSYDLLPGGSNAITGWMTTNEGVEWFKPVQEYNLGPAKDGVSIIDLAWYTSNGTPGGGIQQTFATKPGAKYTVTFYGMNSTYAGRDGTGIVDVLINGNPLSSVNINRNAVTWTLADWQKFTLPFTATTALTTLEFQNHQNAFQHFAFIDAVSVSVPEPATWALMILGLGMVGAGMRQRRKVAYTFG